MNEWDLHMFADSNLVLCHVAIRVRAEPLLGVTEPLPSERFHLLSVHNYHPFVWHWVYWRRATTTTQILPQEFDRCQ